MKWVEREAAIVVRDTFSGRIIILLSSVKEITISRNGLKVTICHKDPVIPPIELDYRTKQDAAEAAAEIRQAVEEGKAK